MRTTLLAAVLVLAGCGAPEPADPTSERIAALEQRRWELEHEYTTRGLEVNEIRFTDSRDAEILQQIAGIDEQIRQLKRAREAGR
jgi:hypothetical protein